MLRFIFVHDDPWKLTCLLCNHVVFSHKIYKQPTAQTVAFDGKERASGTSPVLVTEPKQSNNEAKQLETDEDWEIVEKVPTHKKKRWFRGRTTRAW